MTRRKLGQLEAEILAVLASGGGAPQSIAALQGILDGPPAATTIHTVLTRLLRKGMVAREPQGRSYVYSLAVDESEVAAEKMFSPLRSAHDPRSVLNQFARGLSPDEISALEQILRERGEDLP